MQVARWWALEQAGEVDMGTGRGERYWRCPDHFFNYILGPLPNDREMSHTVV